MRWLREYCQPIRQKGKGLWLGETRSKWRRTAAGDRSGMGIMAIMQIFQTQSTLFGRAVTGLFEVANRLWRARIAMIFAMVWYCSGLRPTAAADQPAGPAAPAAGEASTASDSWFVSRTGGFKLQYPRGWFFGAGPAPADCTGYAPNDMYKKTPFTSFAVVARKRSALEQPASDLATEMLKLGQESLKASLAGYQWRDAGDLQMTAGVGKYLIYSYSQEGQALAGVVYYLIHNQQQFVCHGRCTADQLSTARKIFDGLARSLQPTGDAQPAWERVTDGLRHTDLHCTLTLPEGYRAEQVGSVTIFRQATGDHREAGEPPTTAQLSFAQEPLPAPLQWVVYLETVKRQLRDRLSEYRPGTVTVFSYLLGQDAPSAEEGERQFFEYSHKLDGKIVKVGSLFWLRGQQVLVLTVSAPEADYAAAKERLFMPVAKSWTWEAGNQ